MADGEGGRENGGRAGKSKRRIPPIAGLLLGILAVSTASTWIRLAQADVPSLALAAWRLTFASLMLAPFALTTARPEWRRLQPRDWVCLAVSGAVLAVHFYTWITSLALTSVAASVVLVSTNPLFVALLSHFLLGERVRLQVIIGILIAVAGSAIIGLGDLEAGSSQLLGDLLALIGAVSVAIYMLIGRQQRQHLSLLGYVFPVYGVAALVLLTFSLLSGTPLSGYSARSWGLLLLVALIPQVIGHSSFNWALGHLSPAYVSLAVLAEPIGSTILAWLVLHEPPGSMTLIGAVVILAGIVTATWKRQSGDTAIQDTHP
jgi:drug/metabolite transporter (DMT)-like permease